MGTVTSKNREAFMAAELAKKNPQRKDPLEGPSAEESKAALLDLHDRYVNQEGTKERPWMYHTDLADEIERLPNPPVKLTNAVARYHSHTDRYNRLTGGRDNDGSVGEKLEATFHEVVHRAKGRPKDAQKPKKFPY